MDNKKMMMDKQMAEGIALHQAILLAGMAHKGQLRKGTALPKRKGGASEKSESPAF